MTRPTIVFVGDSVTDCDRRTDPEGLGSGYVRELARSSALAGWTVLNRGISGDRVRDLRRRWTPEVAAVQPDVVSVLIGVNDTWRRFDSNDPTTAAAFESDYRALLDATDRASLVLVEPFVLPVRPEQQEWRADLDEKIDVVRALAAQYNATLVPADAALGQAGNPADLAPDGVHPSPAGHSLLASLWLAQTARVLASRARTRPAEADDEQLPAKRPGASGASPDR